MTQRKREDNPEEEAPQEEIEEVSLEELEELANARRRARDADDLYDTAHTDGSTTNPYLAQQQGLVYDPPSDPPVLPSDDPEGIEIAAGFASSMEETNPDVEDLPRRVDNQDLDLEEDIYTVLHNNSETGHLHHVKAVVRNGIVHLYGTVFSNEDIAIVEYMVRDLEGVADVRNELSVAEE